MTNYNPENSNSEMDIVIQYGNEAGETLRTFTDHVMVESDKSYEVLCDMDKSADESQ